jgi:hypothetical protein
MAQTQFPTMRGTSQFLRQRGHFWLTGSDWTFFKVRGIWTRTDLPSTPPKFATVVINSVASAPACLAPINRFTMIGL